MEKTLRVISNLIGTLVFLVLAGSLGVFYFREKIELFVLDSPLIFPLLVAVGLLILLIINFIDQAKAAKETAGGRPVKELSIVLFFAIGCFLYVFLLQYLHFLIGSFIFLAVGLYFMNDRTNEVGKRILLAAVGSVISVPIFYAVFQLIFSVMLP